MVGPSRRLPYNILRLRSESQKLGPGSAADTSFLADDCRLRSIQHILPQQPAIAIPAISDRLDRLGIILHHLRRGHYRRNGDGPTWPAEGDDGRDFDYDDRVSCVELGE